MTPGEGEGKNESVAPVWQRADGEGRPRETEPIGSELMKVNAGRLDTHADAQTQALSPPPLLIRCSVAIVRTKRSGKSGKLAKAAFHRLFKAPVCKKMA